MITETDRIIALCYIISKGPPEDMADKFTAEQAEMAARTMKVLAMQIAGGKHNVLTDSMVKKIFKEHGHAG